jgi:hypothetical protein
MVLAALVAVGVVVVVLLLVDNRAVPPVRRLAGKATAAANPVV